MNTTSPTMNQVAALVGNWFLKTTSITTSAGKIYTGLIVYQSVDGLLLRDANQQTWRIEASDVESRFKQSLSLMPAGLLKDRSTQDMADLNSYLQGL